MKTIIILAMHGSPPNDFPKSTLMEYFGLHARLVSRTRHQTTHLAPHEPERPVPHCIHKAGETLAEGYG